MDVRKVKTLLELAQKYGVSELEVHEGESSVRISNQVVSADPVPPVVSQVEVSPQQQSFSSSVVVPSIPKDAVVEGHAVKSPIVGVFYCSIKPGDPAFVEVGQTVKKGDILCIVEAMKILNHIESDVSGVVLEVLVDNGEPVEYGQPLFRIKAKK